MVRFMVPRSTSLFLMRWRGSSSVLQSRWAASWALSYYYKPSLKRGHQRLLVSVHLEQGLHVFCIVDLINVLSNYQWPCMERSWTSSFPFASTCHILRKMKLRKTDRLSSTVLFLDRLSGCLLSCWNIMQANGPFGWAHVSALFALYQRSSHITHLRSVHIFPFLLSNGKCGSFLTLLTVHGRSTCLDLTQIVDSTFVVVLQVRDMINAAGYYCEADVSDRKLQKKVSSTSKQFCLCKDFCSD